MSKSIKVIVWGSLAVIVVFPVLVNVLFIWLRIPTGPDLGNPEWLGFIASYIGSLLGVGSGVLAFWFTYRQNEVQHQKDHKENLKQSRLSLRPYLSCGKPTYKEAYRIISVPLTNIGLGTAVGVEIISKFMNQEVTNKVAPHLTIGQRVETEVAIDQPLTDDNCQIYILYRDLLDNKYAQLLRITFAPKTELDLLVVDTLTQPVLYTSYGFDLKPL